MSGYNNDDIMQKLQDVEDNVENLSDMIRHLHAKMEVHFSKMDKLDNHEKQLSYMDAVLYICEMNSIDLEDVKKFISPIIKGKIEAEAMALNFLPKQNTLF